MIGGGLSSVWHDREELSLKGREDVSIEEMSRQIIEFIEEVRQYFKVDKSKVIVGGFSQGGHLSLHLVYGQGMKVGAVFCLSSFLCENSSIYEKQNSLCPCHPPLFMSCGEADQMVSTKWVMMTRDKLEALGVDVLFDVRKRIGHEMERNQLIKLFEWINKIL